MPDRDRPSLRQLEPEDGLLAGLLLLLLQLRDGLLVQLRAGGLSVAGIERRVEALGHGCGVPLAVRRPAGGQRQSEQAGDDGGLWSHDRNFMPRCARSENPVASRRAALTLARGHGAGAAS